MRLKMVVGDISVIGQSGVVMLLIVACLGQGVRRVDHKADEVICYLKGSQFECLDERRF